MLDWLCSTFIYTKEDKSILNYFHPKLLIIRIIFELLSLGFLLTIPIAYFITADWVKYFTLYSYWSVSISIIAVGFGLSSSILKFISYYYYNTITPKGYNWYVNLIDYIRDGMILLSFLQLILSSSSFWMFVRSDDAGLTYASIAAHGIVIFVIILEYLFTVVYVSWWLLIISLYYAGAYYLFTIYLFFHTGDWIYDIENPVKFQKWFLLLIIAPLCQILFYFVVCVVNFAKNKIFAKIGKYFTSGWIKQRIRLGVDAKSHLKIELFISSLTSFIFDLISAFVLIGNLVHIIQQNAGLFTPLLFWEILYFQCEFISFLLLLDYIFVSQKQRVIRYLEGLGLITLIFQIIRLVYGFIGFGIYYHHNWVWFFVSCFSVSFLSILLKLILFHFTSMNKSTAEIFNESENYF